MQKKFIVRLTKEERNTLHAVIKKLKGTSQKVQRAQILLKADADGPAWTDVRIAESFACRRQTVERYVSDLSKRAFSKRWTERNAPTRQPKSC